MKLTFYDDRLMSTEFSTESGCSVLAILPRIAPPCGMISAVQPKKVGHTTTRLIPAMPGCSGLMLTNCYEFETRKVRPPQSSY